MDPQYQSHLLWRWTPLCCQLLSHGDRWIVSIIKVLWASSTEQTFLSLSQFLSVSLVLTQFLSLPLCLRHYVTHTFSSYYISENIRVLTASLPILLYNPMTPPHSTYFSSDLAHANSIQWNEKYIGWHTDTQVDRQTNKQTNKQTNRHTNRLIHLPTI